MLVAKRSVLRWTGRKSLGSVSGTESPAALAAPGRMVLQKGMSRDLV